MSLVHGKLNVHILNDAADALSRNKTHQFLSLLLLQTPGQHLSQGPSAPCFWVRRGCGTSQVCQTLQGLSESTQRSYDLTKCKYLKFCNLFKFETPKVFYWKPISPHSSGNTLGPLFLLSSGETLTRKTFVICLKQGLSSVRIDSSGCISHSLKIAAMTAARVGIPECTIKIFGRWESSAYCLYNRTSTQQVTGIS